jgi:dTDP-4-dehydrorhamnose 3,5-epimerase
MEIIQTGIEGLFLVKLIRFDDERGSFSERFNSNKFAKIGINENFLQDNLSKSHKNVIRGLHAQKGQGKLIGVTKGEIFDVAVDIRKDSKSFGRFFAVNLSAENNLLLMIPDGFLHGFQALSDDSHVVYKVTSEYNPAEQFSVNPLDEDLKINWPNIKDAIINDRDKFSPSLSEIKI